MTRFARARGSKASNEKLPQQATSWAEMRQQLVARQRDEQEAGPRRKAEAQRTANYNAFLKEMQDKKKGAPQWAEIEEEHKWTEQEIEQGIEEMCRSDEEVDQQLRPLMAKVKALTMQKTKKKATKTAKKKNCESSSEEPLKGAVGVARKKLKKGKQLPETETGQGIKKKTIKKKKIVGKKTGKLGLRQSKVKEEVKEEEEEEEPTEQEDMTMAVVSPETSKNIDSPKKKPFGSMKKKTIGNLKKKKKKKNNSDDDDDDDETYQPTKPFKGLQWAEIHVKQEVEHEVKQEAKEAWEPQDTPPWNTTHSPGNRRQHNADMRRQKRALARQTNKTCFQCRQVGHTAYDCPEAAKAGGGAAPALGLCYKCGSTEHKQSECRSAAGRKGAEFRFAVCFVCNQQGHLARACPDNAGGAYPHGGACRQCGDVRHLVRDCPQVQSKRQQQPKREQWLAEPTSEWRDADDDATSKQTSDVRQGKKRKFVKFARR